MKTFKFTLAFLIVAGIAASVEAAETKTSQNEIRTAGLFQNSNFYNGSRNNSYRRPYRPVGYQTRNYQPAMNCSNGICRPVTNTANCANGQCNRTGSCANGQCGLNGSCAHGNCDPRKCANGRCNVNSYGNQYYGTRQNSEYRNWNLPRLQSPITFQPKTNYYRPVNYHNSRPATNRYGW